jgi:hypothetical protein
MAGLREASRKRLGVLLLCAGGAVFHLSAQRVVSARAGLITYLQGSVAIDGKWLVLKTGRFPQMKDGETLSTDPGRSRVELLLAPGIVLRLAENSQVRMDDTQLSDTRVTLQKGEALIEVVQLAEGSRVQVAVGQTTIDLTRAGLYRIGKAQNATQNSTEQNTLRVYGGEALVRSGLNTADAKRGMAVSLDADLAVSRFDRKQTDSLHAWAARRSLALFMGDPDARRKQTHWQDTGGGYVENKNFGVGFQTYIRRAQPSAERPAIPSAQHP